MKERQPSPHHIRWSKIALASLFVTGLVAFFALGGPGYLDLAVIKANREVLRAFTEQHFAAALALGFLIYVGAVALSLPGASVLSLAVGFVFGRWVGSALVLVAGTVGATIVFLAARYLFADWARHRMGPSGERISAGFTANAFNYLLFLRLVPLFPFFLVNLAPAFTRIPARTYVLATFVGIIPGTFVFVNLGEALGRIDSMRGLLSAETLIAFGLLATLALVPVFVRNRRRREK